MNKELFKELYDLSNKVDEVKISFRTKGPGYLIQLTADYRGKKLACEKEFSDRAWLKTDGMVNQIYMLIENFDELPDGTNSK